MRRQNLFGMVILVTGTAIGLPGCSENPVVISPQPVLGPPANLGEGTVSAYADFDEGGVPAAIGVVFSASALSSLPSGSDLHHCFDRNGDGVVDEGMECNVWHERVLQLPSEASRRSDMPFKWSLLNWNPEGHIPPGVYDVPHFDIHFYMEPIEDIFAIESGPCGIEFIRCDQFELALKPLPPNYIHPDFQNVDAAAPAMGNHMIDLTSPEFHDEAFTRTWIYGKYDGRITFYEEMLTLEYLMGQPNECVEIKSPEAVGLSGYYPTLSWVRYNAQSDEYTVSIEEFLLREASPPDPIPEEPQS